MKIASKHPLLVGTAVLTLASLALYGCKNFLTDASKPQGTLDQSTLANAAGVEGTLIAAYRTLDCTANTNSDWGCAASNWVWASVAADDAYKGSTLGDQPPINDVEGYHWGTADARALPQHEVAGVYEGISRANATLRLLKQVQAASPGAISPADASGIEGEAIFLRAHYHFEAYRMWGGIPYYREDDTDFRKANLTASDVAAEILKDLDAAIAKLPATPRNGEVGRATSWTAKAYKGRVLMYAGQYAAAMHSLRGREEQRAVRAGDELSTRSGPGFKQFGTVRKRSWPIRLGERRRAERQQRQLRRAAELPVLRKSLRLLRLQPAIAEPRQLLQDRRATGLPLVMVDSTTWNADDANLDAHANHGTGGSATRLDGRSRQRAVQGLGLFQPRGRVGARRRQWWSVQPEEKRSGEGERCRIHVRGWQPPAGKLGPHSLVPIRRPAPDARRGVCRAESTSRMHRRS